MACPACATHDVGSLSVLHRLLPGTDTQALLLRDPSVLLLVMNNRRLSIW